jgi:hypothetical protein
LPLDQPESHDVLFRAAAVTLDSPVLKESKKLTATVTSEDLHTTAEFVLEIMEDDIVRYTLSDLFLGHGLHEK